MQTRLMKASSQSLYFPVCALHLRRGARTPALESKDIGVGGNGAAMTTEDPEGRESLLLGYTDV